MTIAGTADEHGRRVTRLAADQVQHVVHAVREVDVEHAGRSKHHRVARRAAAEGVAGAVFEAIVGLDLGHQVRRLDALAFAHQELADQLLGNGDGSLREER